MSLRILKLNTAIQITVGLFFRNVYHWLGLSVDGLGWKENGLMPISGLIVSIPNVT